MADETTTLDRFLAFADAVQASAEAAHRPAYSETCRCGASVEVSRDVPAAERRRIYTTFIGGHSRCTAHYTPEMPGQDSAQ